MEKAWTFARPTTGSFYTTNLGTYNMINGGGPGELLGTMGYFLEGTTASSSVVSAVWEAAALNTRAGKEVVVCTNSTVGSGLKGSHCYFFDSINYELVEGTWEATSVTLRNPWGGSDEFVTISVFEFNESIWSEASAYVSGSARGSSAQRLST